MDPISIDDPELGTLLAKQLEQSWLTERMMAGERCAACGNGAPKEFFAVPGSDTLLTCERCRG